MCNVSRYCGCEYIILKMQHCKLYRFKLGEGVLQCVVLPVPMCAPLKLLIFFLDKPEIADLK